MERVDSAWISTVQCPDVHSERTERALEHTGNKEAIEDILRCQHNRKAGKLSVDCYGRHKSLGSSSGLQQPRMSEQKSVAGSDITKRIEPHIRG